MGKRLRGWTTIGLMADIALYPLAMLRVESSFVRTDAPVLFVSNHRSLVDSLVGFAVFRRIGVQPRAFVAARFFRNPVLGFLLRHLRAIPAGREPGEAVSLACAAIADGDDVAVMVQGRLTEVDRERDLAATMRGGAARIVMQTGASIVPLWVSGSELVWPKDRRLPILSMRRRTIVVWIGPAQPVAGDSVSDVNGQIAEMLLALAQVR